jgi:hypothetical protein
MQRNQTLNCLLISAALLTASAALAQKKAPLSPPASTSITVNGKTISIKYSAPSLRGRQFIGGLHQYGQVWRAGANSATSLHTDADLDIGGLSVPKGDYTLYVLLDPNAWQLIINKQTGQWGTVYNQEQDLGRVKMTMSKPASPVETYKITLAEQGGNKARLQMEWENSIATVPITVK